MIHIYGDIIRSDITSKKRAKLAECKNRYQFDRPKTLGLKWHASVLIVLLCVSLRNLSLLDVMLLNRKLITSINYSELSVSNFVFFVFSCMNNFNR